MGISHFRRQHAPLEQLLAEAKSTDGDDSAAMNEIVRRFDPLARRISRRLTSSPPLREDIENAARLALVRAVRRHDPSAFGFPAYAKLFMRGAARREHERWLPPKMVDGTRVDVVTKGDVSAPSNTVRTGCAPEADMHGWGDGRIAQVAALLPASQRELLRRRYIDDADLLQIAQETGTSVSAVSQRLGTVHRRLLKAGAA